MNALASRFSDIAAVGARLRHFAPELSLFAVKGPPALDSRMTIEAFERRIHGAPAGRAVGGKIGGLSVRRRERGCTNERGKHAPPPCVAI
jgi:hypothetical protein